MADEQSPAQRASSPGRRGAPAFVSAVLRPGRLGARLGLAVVALGLIIIGIGWNGAAGAGGQINHVSDLRAQLPWLLSGGFLGLGVVVLGAALVITESNRENRLRLEQKLDEMVEALERTSAAGTVTPAAPVDASRLVAVGASSYHRPDCHLVDGRKEVEYLTPEEASDRGLKPCRICDPEPARAGA
ncbi:MAG TPA: hypothetical protein VFA11_16765 [Acidimicrobiales bacterium]|nr:hypothetical protein [Acidimicrobiales bacterium]